MRDCVRRQQGGPDTIVDTPFILTGQYLKTIKRSHFFLNNLVNLKKILNQK
jgi:hypothetical protein